MPTLSGRSQDWCDIGIVACMTDVNREPACIAKASRSSVLFVVSACTAKASSSSALHPHYQGRHYQGRAVSTPAPDNEAGKSLHAASKRCRQMGARQGHSCLHLTLNTDKAVTTTPITVAFALW